MQVHVLPNVSDPFPEKIVRERLDGAIRLLRGETAGYSFLYNGSKPYHIGDGTIRFCSPPFIRHIADPVAVIANPTKDYRPPPRSRRNEQPLPQ